MADTSRTVDGKHLQAALEDITRDLRTMAKRGHATQKIDLLSEVDPGQFGIAILMRNGDMIVAGDADTPFSIQSISKVFSLELALQKLGDDLWKRVGREPSGDPYNSIMDLEHHKGCPRNPFINAGALVVVDALIDELDDAAETEAVINFVGGLLKGETFGVNDEVAQSDEASSNVNYALCHLTKHFGNFHNDIGAVMKAYVRQCAIELSCRQLARVGRFLMIDGYDERAHSEGDAARRVRRILSLMMTCGQYDGSGDFAYRVGLPAKSGVGGGILAIAPNIASIAVWSPGLDDDGNSLLGTLALERLTCEVDWSVFGAIRT